jgi:signal transduction histidine kinase
MPAKINLYRILQEAIANIVRHSGATQASIAISQTNGTVQTIIEDNGKGFTAGASTESGQSGRQGFGLKSMTERMNLIGGTITFDSSPGKGTTIRMTIPIHK